MPSKQKETILRTLGSISNIILSTNLKAEDYKFENFSIAEYSTQFNDEVIREVLFNGFAFPHEKNNYGGKYIRTVYEASQTSAGTTTYSMKFLKTGDDLKSLSNIVRKLPDYIEHLKEKCK